MFLINPLDPNEKFQFNDGGRSAAGKVTPSCELQTKFTLAEMERFAVEAWGDLGMKAVKKWAELNAAYFDNRLLPIPIILTQTQPYEIVSPTARAANMSSAGEGSGSIYPIALIVSLPTTTRSCTR